MRHLSKLSVPAKVLIYSIIVLIIGLFPSQMHFHYVPMGLTFWDACGGWSWKIVIGLFGTLLPPTIFVFYNAGWQWFCNVEKAADFYSYLESGVCASTAIRANII